MVVVLAMGWWAGTVVRVGGCGVAISHSVSISVVSRGFWASVVGGVEVVGSVWECPDSLGQVGFSEWVGGVLRVGGLCEGMGIIFRDLGDCLGLVGVCAGRFWACVGRVLG